MGCAHSRYASIAQRTEHVVSAHGGGGSNPSRRSIFFMPDSSNGRAAVLQAADGSSILSSGTQGLKALR